MPEKTLELPKQRSKHRIPSKGQLHRASGVEWRLNWKKIKLRRGVRNKNSDYFPIMFQTLNFTH